MRGRWEEREKETGALLKGEMVMQAAWWGRALQVLNMDLWWSSITHWAIKGALHRRSSVNAVHASEHDHRACAHHRAALQWYKSAFKGGLNPCPFALTATKCPPPTMCYHTSRKQNKNKRVKHATGAGYRQSNNVAARSTQQDPRLWSFSFYFRDTFQLHTWCLVGPIFELWYIFFIIWGNNMGLLH